MLSLRNVSKSYSGPRRKTVLRDISLELAAGEYVAVMGESGIGKSTLLNLIAGLDRPDGGEILLDGRNLAGLDDDALTELRRSHLGFVFQAFHVLPYLSVAQNVALPLVLNGVRDGEIAPRVAAMLASVGRSSVAMRCSSVLLPEPLGPMTTWNSPCGISSVTSRSAQTFCVPRA